MNKAYQLPTEGQIAKWKKQHGTLHKLTVKVPGQEDAICIVRPPKVSDISMSAQLGNGDEFQIGKLQLEACWLHGDERIKNRLAFTQAAAIQMGRIFEVFPWTIETVDVTKELIEKLTTQGVDAEVISRVSDEGVVRKVVILNGTKPVLKDGEDQREKLEAIFCQPNLKIKEKADLMTEFLDQGSVYIKECFLSGDERFKNHSDEHIAFASYMAGNSLLEQLTAEVEKL